jgi:plastocyanin
MSSLARHFRGAVSFALLSAVGSCGGGSSTTPPPPPPPPPPLVLAAGTPSGNGQSAVVGQALSEPLRVRGTRGGAAAPNEPVTWAASAGQIVGSGPTGADGTATATWTLSNTVGAHTATATSGNQTVQFTATATAAPQANLAIAFGTPSGNNQTAVLGSSLADLLRVVVTNNGAPAAGIVVIWETAVPFGFFNPTQSTTNAQGVATAAWTLGTTVGAQAATAFAGTTLGPSVAFAATATPGQGGTTVDVSVSLAGGGQFAPTTVVIAAGTTVRWTWVDDVHTVTSTGTPAFPGHPANASPPTVYEFTFAAPGTYRYYCTVHGTPTTGMRGTVVVQ